MNYKRTSISIALIILIIATIAVVTLFYTNKESIYFILGSGVLASILASLVFAALSSLLLREPASERDELKELVAEFHERQLHGVVKVSPKFEQNPEYWNGLIAGSSLQLDMLGHAFTTWTHHPHAESFAQKIRLIAKNGGLVRIVILDPEGENTQGCQLDSANHTQSVPRKHYHFLNLKFMQSLIKHRKRELSLNWKRIVMFHICT
ncbi:hypothetical protein [Vibrio harveyi]|uniref:hypothetical protein n=1 Tax=Vibrio harveyi TaxID=669 RepID=UPI0030F79984